MVLLVNGGIFLAVGLLALANGFAIQRGGQECATGNETQCARGVVVGTSTLRVAPYLLAVSVLLFGTGLTLWLHRRWRTPEEPPTLDEGPTYP